MKKIKNFLKNLYAEVVLRITGAKSYKSSDKSTIPSKSKSALGFSVSGFILGISIGSIFLTITSMGGFIPILLVYLISIKIGGVIERKFTSKEERGVLWAIIIILFVVASYLRGIRMYESYI